MKQLVAIRCVSTKLKTFLVQHSSPFVACLWLEAICREILGIQQAQFKTNNKHFAQQHKLLFKLLWGLTKVIVYTQQFYRLLLLPKLDLFLGLLRKQLHAVIAVTTAHRLAMYCNSYIMWFAMFLLNKSAVNVQDF